jgi:hypothetical protein
MEKCENMQTGAGLLSDDTRLQSMLVDEAGPDVFHVRVDGAERAAMSRGVYEGQCRYRFDFRLRNAGRVWLSAWHFYEVSANTCSRASI